MQSVNVERMSRLYLFSVPGINCNLHAYLIVKLRVLL
jgi:hypothetical protein